MRLTATLQGSNRLSCLAICLVCVLVALCSLDVARAQPNPRSQSSGLPTPPAAPGNLQNLGIDAGSVLNSLQNAFGGTNANNGENLPVPGHPHAAPYADQRLIPVQSQPLNDAVIEHNEGNISLMVRDASLRQVVALIAETQNLNLVFATPADIPVTASFNNIPWQQVLDSLLAASGHAWTSHQGVITVTSVSNAGTLSAAAGGRRVEVIELDFASAVDIDQAVKGLLSPVGQSWIMETASDDNRRTREAIVVVDYPQNLAQIQEYICRADQPPRQVLIEANILQVELASDCRSGVNWDALSTSINGNELNWRTVGFANAANTSAFFFEATGGAVESLIELVQNTTDAKTLASPKVLVVSGQEARMQVGEQLGFRVQTFTQTSTLEEVQFLDVGVVLSVTPRITRDGRVLMRIKPEVSQGQVDPETGLPSEETTEVETDILLSNGQGMVIGGLIQEKDSNIQSKVPWLGDLPYIGILFQRRLIEKQRSEIIVTLVPHVQPYDPIVAERNAHGYMRTVDRLTKGPLDINYRPYEAMLPDTFRNPRRPFLALKRLPPVSEEGGTFPTTETPYPLEFDDAQVVVEPQPSKEQAPASKLPVIRLPAPFKP